MVDVYRAVNLVNGKSYIGVSVRGTRSRQMTHFSSARKGSKFRFHCAIRKYGESAFCFATVATVATLAEAHAEERRLIALWKPEYNMTKGGEGVLGLRMSPKTLAEMSARMKANPIRYWLGKKRDEETKRKVGQFFKGRKVGPRKSPHQAARDNLAEIGRQHNDEWQKKYARLGPAAMARSVVCLTDGKVYESASEAARQCGVARSALIELCLGQRGRKTVGGLRFAYVAPLEVTKSNAHTESASIRGN